MKTYIAMITTPDNCFCHSREIQASDRLQAEAYADDWAQKMRQQTGLAWHACPSRLHDPRMEYATAKRQARQSAEMALRTWAHLMVNVSTLSEQSPKKAAARATYHQLDQYTISDDVRCLAQEILFTVIGPDPRAPQEA